MFDGIEVSENQFVVAWDANVRDVKPLTSLNAIVSFGGPRLLAGGRNEGEVWLLGSLIHMFVFCSFSCREHASLSRDRRRRGVGSLGSLFFSLLLVVVAGGPSNVIDSVVCREFDVLLSWEKMSSWLLLPERRSIKLFVGWLCSASSSSVFICS